MTLVPWIFGAGLGPAYSGDEEDVLSGRRSISGAAQDDAEQVGEGGGEVESPCVEPEREEIAYPGGKFTYRTKEAREKQLCAGDASCIANNDSTTLLINDSQNFCDLKRNSPVYTGCPRDEDGIPYTYASKHDCDTECGVGCVESQWINE